MLYGKGRKTDDAHWEAVSEGLIKDRLPSKLNVDVLNTTRLLKRIVRPGSRYIEIGCAPGKMLAWVSSVLRADVVGLDYSESGIAKCRALFEIMGVEVNLHLIDFFNHNLPPASFDVVTSFGFIEHFDDPRPVVQKHIDLVKPEGVVLIVVPNYGGVYGSLQRYCDPDNLTLHNLEIMSPSALKELVDSPDVGNTLAYAFGSMSPWLVTLEKRLPWSVARLVSLGINALGLVQPIKIKSIAPMLVLEIRKGQVV